MRPPALLLLGLACRSDAPTPDGRSAHAVLLPLLQAFPSQELVDADGRVDIPQGALPQSIGGTPFPIDRVNGRDGFSPSQTSVVDLGVDLDPSSLPADLESGGSVQLWDLDAGIAWPARVELDAWPDNPEPAVLLIRPMAPLPIGHRVAVVLTDALRAADGGSLPVDAYAAAVAGQPVTGRWADSAARIQDLDAELADLGVQNRLLAFSFPVGDPTGPTRQVAAQAPLPSTWDWERVEEAATPGELGEGIWKRARGSFPTTGWLGEDGRFILDESGALTPGATWSAELFVLLPESLRDAPLESAPVWLFGHGIFSSPYLYLGDPSDPNSVIALANQAGAIVVATAWPGLVTTDVSIPLEVAADFGRFPILTDRLVQGVGNQVALSRLLVEGALLEDPVFAGRADPVVQTGGLRWFGISLGGIAGAVTVAVNPHISHAVLHVGGSSWSTMLERSDTWETFESLMVRGLPSPRDRQQLIAASQLFWDGADPASFVEDLRGRSILWQAALGDERVSNRTTESLLRGLVPSPAVLAPWPESGLPPGFSVLSAEDGPLLSIFDPEVPLPPDQNRPPPTTGAHEAPRHWPGMHQQVIRFLDPEDPGVVEHFCGDAPCSADNPGG